MLKQEFHIPNACVNNRASPVRWIISHICQHRWFMVACLVGVFIANGTNVFIPVLSGRAVDAVVDGDAETLRTLTNIALMMLGIIAARGVADLGGQYAMEVIAVIFPIVVIGTTNWRLLLAPLVFVSLFVWALRRYMNELTPVSDNLRKGYGHWRCLDVSQYQTPV